MRISVDVNMNLLLPDAPGRPSLWSRTVSMKTSNRPTRSVGPAMCSGWNWTLGNREKVARNIGHSSKQVIERTQNSVEAEEFYLKHSQKGFKELFLCIVHTLVFVLGLNYIQTLWSCEEKGGKKHLWK